MPAWVRRATAEFRRVGAAFVLLCVLPIITVCAGEPERLTQDGRLKLAPTFTSDGEAVVYSVHDVPNRVSLMKLDLADGSQELVHPTLNDHQFDAAFSGDGRYHCFAMSSGSPQLVLVIKDLLEKRETVFRPDGARSTARTPQFLPDASRVIFTLSAPGGQQIASVDINGGDLKRLTQSTGINCWPSVSPNGKQIAFSSSRDGNFDVYIMPAAGAGDVQRLTQSGQRETRPAWSPDGTRIAFTSLRGGNHELFVMDADGGNPQQVTDHPARDDFAIWHPDGDRLLAVSERDGGFDLYLFDVPNPGD
jgi:Tol biopolymer transport system component